MDNGDAWNYEFCYRIKDLTRRIGSDKILCNETFNIAKN